MKRYSLNSQGKMEESINGSWERTEDVRLEVRNIKSRVDQLQTLLKVSKIDLAQCEENTYIEDETGACAIERMLSKLQWCDDGCYDNDELWNYASQLRFKG